MRRRSFPTVLVGPSALLREGLTRILSAADFRIIASASCVDDLVRTALPRQDAILLVIDAGDSLNAAVGEIGRFKQRYPAGRVALLSDHSQLSDVVTAFRAGANAFFVKVAPCETFIKSLELVVLGETILPAAALSALHFLNDDGDRPILAVRDDSLAAESPLESKIDDTPQLSTREKCILQALIEGDSNKAIARKINIAEATVKVHVKAILRKIRVHNRTQAAIWAMSNDLSLAPVGNGSSAGAKTVVHPPLNSHLIPTLPITHGSALLPEMPQVTERSERAPHHALPGGDRVVRMKRRGY